MLLLDQLIKDEKKVNRALYSSGPYWDYKNTKAVSELRKKGLSEFRGINSGVGSSFADNLEHQKSMFSIDALRRRHLYFSS